MSMNKLTILGIVVIFVGFMVFSALFIVHQTEQAIVLQFGKPKAVIQTSGLHFKMPFVQNVQFYERRVLAVDPPREQLILADQKRLDVDAYGRYRIVDPLRFFQTVGTVQGVNSRLNSVINSSLRRVLGNVTLQTVLSKDREKIMRDIRKEVDENSIRFGIKIVDVRIRRADLPEQAGQAIYARMRSERDREAREARAHGFETGQRIRAAADRERTVLLAEADKDAEILKGEGDGEATRIYNDAYSRDLPFYRFYRSMQAYRKSLSSEDTTMVLSPESEFFSFFRDLSGTMPKPAK